MTGHLPGEVGQASEGFSIPASVLSGSLNSIPLIVIGFNLQKASFMKTKWLQRFQTYL